MQFRGPQEHINDPGPFNVLASASGHNGFAALAGLYLLATVVPSFAGLVRRLHDTDHSGWWFFISLVPLVDPFVLLSFTIKDSDPGSNRFGPNPKAEPVTGADPESGLSCATVASGRTLTATLSEPTGYQLLLSDGLAFAGVRFPVQWPAKTS